MEAEADFSRSKAVSCKVDRNTETVILWFFDRTGVILETPELFMKACFTRKLRCAYLPVFISSWMMQEHWDSDLFCFGDGRAEYGGFSRHFFVLYKSQRTCHFFIAPKNCIF